MGRFVSPGSLRFGKTVGWKKISENVEGFWKSKEFLNYINGVCNKYLLLQEGIIFGDAEFSYKKKEVKIVLPIYDRTLELALRDVVSNGSSVESLIERAIGRKLLLIKYLLILEGTKYYKVPVKVEFVCLSMRGLSAEMLSKYIAYNLERGYSLVEILRVVSREFWSNRNKVSKKLNTELAHRHRGVFSEDSNVFRPEYIGDKKLLGFRIDCAGRFSRRQRASSKSVREGTVPLGGFKGYLDYGRSLSILEYGACSIRVWLYFENEGKESLYLFKY